MDRLVDARDFRRLSRSGRRSVSSSFIVLAGKVEREPTGARLGITASRRVGGAVERNRVKRVVREWFRRRRCSLQCDLDLVVIARAPAVGLGAMEAARELDALLREGGA